MTQPLAHKILTLSVSHPMPSEHKLKRQIERLGFMANFYRDKIPEAPEKQALMFTGFISALMYAEATIRQYQKLTKEVADAAAEESNA
jgi:hypothetical protein